MKSFKYLFSLLLLIAAFSVSAQTVYFCEGVDDDGYPEGEASTFTIPSDGGYLYVLTRLPYECGTDEIVLDIYTVDYDGYETFSTTLYMDVESNWAWFWKKVTFYDSGTYKVYVYDGDDNFLASGKVKITF